MPTANFGDSQFVDAVMLNTAAALPATSLQQHGDELHTAGILNPGAITLSTSGLTVTANLAGTAFLFGSGVLALPIGTADGATSASYAVNFAPLVPGSGTAEVYLVATAATVRQNPLQIVGPPKSHPDYDDTFAPYTSYQEVDDTLTVTATTAVPDNIATIEIGRVLLGAGATSIPALDVSHRVYASAVLSPTGVVPGSYATPTVTVGTDGRITGIAATGPYLPLSGGTLAGPGNLVISGALNVTGGVGVTGGLNVAGSAGLKAVTATTVQTTGNVTVGGNLEVSAGFLSSFATNLNVGAAVVQITNSLGTALNTLNIASGTTGNEAVSIAQFGFATGGVARFPVGSGLSFIIEWGTFIVNSGGSIQDFNYAATFPNACLAIMACYQAATPPLSGAVGVQPVNTVGFAAIDTSPGGSSHGCNYIALGF